VSSASGDFHRVALSAGRVERIEIRRADRPLSWGEVLQRWREDAGFVDAFVGCLASVPFPAWLWETPALSDGTRDRAFECVLVRNERLARFQADDLAFAEHIRGQRGIRVFENLGGDARLVVPCREGDARAYPHLAAFLRAGPGDQVRTLWERLSCSVEERLSASPGPCWVSTSGLGVPWVHVRIDECPKYYAHAPYRSPGARALDDRRGPQGFTTM